MPGPALKPKEYLTLYLGRIGSCKIQFHDKVYHLEAHFVLAGNGWGVNDSFPLTDAHLNRLDSLMRLAKVTEFDRLKGMPIEATLDGNLLKSWRILTEVL